MTTPSASLHSGGARRSFARDPFDVAREVQKPAALTYPDYLSMGREWVRERITAAAMSRGRLPVFNASYIEDAARKFADVNCPADVRRAHFAALNGPGDPRFDPPYPMVMKPRKAVLS